MGLIKILPDTLISQIAAGEVVERPASVVKELVENSLDAGADFISVEIEQGGMKLICVRDNGFGMSREDSDMAFARHATSKIAALDDLNTLRSFGFRGEALAAIASVAIVKMKTRQSEAQAGTEIVYRGGIKESHTTIGCPPGTEIFVENLFFNTPARKKFLKMESTEVGHTAAVISHAALAHPTVGFEFKSNGKSIISVPPDSQIEARLLAILGRDFFEQSARVSFSTPSIKIHGFIGQPGMTAASRRHQYLFINGRDVADPLVARAVLDAYGSRMPGRQYPMFLINIEVDPAEVDVNVHPRKLSVKFFEPNRIYRDVRQAVSQALDEYQKNIFANVPQMKSQNFTGSKMVQEAISFSQEFAGQVSEQEKRDGGLASDELSQNSMQILGQIANSYILIHDEEGIAIIDQHAAHERILYEKIKARTESGAKNTQPLLVPLNIECSAQEATVLEKTLTHLEGIGFEFDKWSGNTFVCRACPAALKKENLAKIFREFLDEMLSEKEHGAVLPEKILKTMACKAAVKFGMPLSIQEQRELLAELKHTPNSSTCPHGRPVRVLLTFDELERRFYRK